MIWNLNSFVYAKIWVDILKLDNKMLNTIINIFSNIFYWASSWHIILSNEQVFQICRNIIEWWQILFYCLLVFLYLLLTHKICKFFWWWSKLWWINKTHVLTYIIIFSIWLLLWKFFIHPSYLTIEENSNILAWKITETIEYKKWE